MKNFALILIAIFLVLGGCYYFSHKPDNDVEEDLYNEILKRDFIKVGINTEAKPFGFIDKDGNIQGYDADLGRYIAQYLLSNQNKVQFIPVTPSNRFLKASTGEADIVIATMTITPQRKEIISFSVPYDIAGQAILVNSKSLINSASDLAGQNIGVIWGTTAEKNLLNLIPTANIVGFKTYDEAYNALKNGQINAITSDDTILSRYAFEDNDMKLLSKRYSKEPYGIGFKKGKSTAKLEQKINFAINDMRQKGVILRLHKTWLKQEETQQNEQQEQKQEKNRLTENIPEELPEEIEIPEELPEEVQISEDLTEDKNPEGNSLNSSD